MSNAVAIVLVLAVSALATFLLFLPTLTAISVQKKAQERLRIQLIEQRLERENTLAKLTEMRNEREEKELSKYLSFCNLIRIRPYELRSVMLYNRVQSKVKAYLDEVEI